MAEGVLFNLAEDILKHLGSRALAEIASAWGFKGQLKKLTDTINTIKGVLLDAEERQQHSHAIRRWLEGLTEVVYAADDLFDEFATKASQKEVMGGSKYTKEVKTFFSGSNQIAFAFSISHKAKKIREALDDIVSDAHQFNFLKHSCEERRVGPKHKLETHSFVGAEGIIGRDADRKAILDILDQYQDHPVSVIPIVGMGGLGKTALAQLVYNDDEVKKHFDLRLWVCVSDDFDVKEIVRKILMSATNNEHQNLELDQLRKKMQDQIVGKRYLLALDDVWNEDRQKWLELSNLVNFGREGSKILVTTRSQNVAKIMGTIPSPYELKGLQEEDSWSLFKTMAFEPGQECKSPVLESIGKEIVQKCGHVPLAIKALGCLLYGKDESKWLSFKEKNLAQISGGDGDLMNILELSYYHLRSSLKSCFAYCAVFPKDYEFNKETLISLWMAQGLVIPMSESQSLEEAGEEYFSTLLHRCFFQDVKRDEWENVATCKMHDLIHDLAVKVAGIGCKLVAKQGEIDFDEKIHHVSFGYQLTSSWKMPNNVLKLPRLRTFLLPEQIRDGTILREPICNQLLSSCRWLRVLDLHGLGIRCLPSSIGKLIHLRYLNLSKTAIEALPNSITKLQNLQTLKLFECRQLRGLPADIFKKLTNLRSLDVLWTPFSLPSGLGQLTSLHKLTYLRVCMDKLGKEKTATLSDLKNLNNLRGSLRILLRSAISDPMHEAKEANLGSKRGLKELNIDWRWGEQGSGIDWRWGEQGSENSEALLGGLKPHPNLKKLTIGSYRGVRLPNWAQMDNLCTSLPYLVDIHLWWFLGCQQVPTFCHLRFLKRLQLHCFPEVEYMESGDALLEVCSLREEALFFPSLQELTLWSMDNLKGWWKVGGEVVSNGQKDELVQLPKLQHLSKLEIKHCRKMMSMPLCPNLEELRLVGVNETLSVLKMATRSTAGVVATTSASSPASYSKLKILEFDNVEELISLPKDCLHHLFSLCIRDKKLLSISGLGEVFKNLNSLRHLELRDCSSLRSLSGGLEHLTTLEKLVILGAHELDFSADEDMPWKALKNLQSLELREMDKLVALPNGLRHLTNLRSLCIASNGKLKELPEWISCLSSLQQMELEWCPELTSLPEGFRELTGLKKLQISVCEQLEERCQGPDGEDWPKIHHIPCIIFGG